ncbi:hypothetical protein OQA88_1034 [Cercophora sp. LCS_1]
MLLAFAVLFFCGQTGGLAAEAPQLPILVSKPPTSAETTRNALKDLLPTVEKLRDIGGTAGISIAVLNHGEVIDEFSLGFSDRDRHLIANPNTLYPLGSLTKAFVATTISELVYEGLLDWDKPITAYIPELHFTADTYLADRLTLVDLLSHQIGLERLDGFWLGAENEVLVPKNLTLAAINQLAPAYPLRTKWQYNNWMYALAGEIIERVTYGSWGSALQTRVLDPLQLRQTTVIESKIPADSTARPYMVTDDGEAVQIADVPLLDGTTMSPAGRVRSSAHDMLIWAKALMAGFRGDPSPLHRIGDVLSGYAITNRSSGFDELYALGLAKVTTPTQFGKMGFNPNLVDVMPLIGEDRPPTSIFYHNGAMPGYNHCLMMVPSQQAAIVVLTNSISQGDVADWVAQTILQAVIGSTHPLDLVPIADGAAKRWRTRYTTMVETLEKGRTPNTKETPHPAIIGAYQHKTQALWIQVFEEGGVLKFRVNGRDTQTHILRHYHYDTFCFLPSAEERISRALFHYAAPSWLLHFQRKEDTGEVWAIKWKLGNQVTDGEIFTRVPK